MKETHYSGRVSNVVYTNGDFRVMRVMLDGQPTPTPVTVKGNFRAQNVVPGSWVSFEGKWEDHESYGRQLSATKSPVSVPRWSPETALSALAGNGVGPDIIRKLDKTFGDDLLRVLDKGEASLRLAGLDEFTSVFVASRWRSLRLYLDAMRFLIEAGVSPHALSKVWEMFDVSVEEMITTDPWVLVRVEGIDFQQADEVALRLGISLDNPGRIRGAVFHAVHNCRTDGHLYASIGNVIGEVGRQMPGKGEDHRAIADAIADLSKSSSVVVDRTTRDGVTAVYAPAVHKMAGIAASRLVDRVTTFTRKDMKSLKDALRKVGPEAEGIRKTAGLEHVAHAALNDWSKGTNITLTEVQRLGAARALSSPVSVLTGLPGTGKTTTLKAVVSVLRDAGVQFLLCAPTGIAAKRMSALANAPASTIHRAFGAQDIRFNDNRESTYVGVVGDSRRSIMSSDPKARWKHDIDKPHPAKVVIIDECSMMDLHLLYRVLVGTDPTCRLVFVGDAEQLPSVGAGDVLRDLAASGVFPVTRLTEIFRQDEASGIVIAAHAIHSGSAPEADGKDFVFMPERSDEAVADTVVRLAEGLYARRANFQILSPRHGGTIGVTSLNHRIRTRLNPGGPGLAEIRLGKSVVREDDRIMVVRNNYEMDIYNGDTGKVARIDRKSREIVIKIHGPENQMARQINLAFSEASKYLRLAYAQTVHKCQGSEYDVIVLPMVSSFGRQLQRNLFYTAVTRARKKVIVVGASSAMVRAASNDKADRRNTLFADRLRLAAGGCGRPSSGRGKRTQAGGSNE
jgi:exodeoxyribonuclease V alpha subunit